MSIAEKRFEGGVSVNLTFSSCFQGLTYAVILIFLVSEDSCESGCVLNIIYKG